jgi:hypothetical protein
MVTRYGKVLVFLFLGAIIFSNLAKADSISINSNANVNFSIYNGVISQSSTYNIYLYGPSPAGTFPMIGSPITPSNTDVSIKNLRIYTDVYAKDISNTMPTPGTMGKISASYTYYDASSYQGWQWQTMPGMPGMPSTGYWSGGMNGSHSVNWLVNDGSDSKGHYLFLQAATSADNIRVAYSSFTGTSPSNYSDQNTTFNPYTWAGYGNASISFSSSSAVVGARDAYFDIISGGTGFTQKIAAPVSAMGNMAAVPLPPSVYLFGSGLVGLIGFRRFRRS